MPTHKPRGVVMVSLFREDAEKLYKDVRWCNGGPPPSGEQRLRMMDALAEALGETLHIRPEPGRVEDIHTPRIEAAIAAGTVMLSELVERAREEEREACAAICDARVEHREAMANFVDPGAREIVFAKGSEARVCAQKIRARGAK